jgi:hypothetical protein
MNTSDIDSVITELSEEYQPAEQLLAWAERRSDVD